MIRKNERATFGVLENTRVGHGALFFKHDHSLPSPLPPLCFLSTIRKQEFDPLILLRESVNLFDAFLIDDTVKHEVYNCYEYIRVMYNESTSFN